MRGVTSVAFRGARFAWRDPRSAALLLRMAGWVAAFSVLVKVLPLPRALRLLTPRRRSSLQRSHVPQTKLAQLLDSLLKTNFLVFTPICWKRASILYRYLALNGVEARVVFGVRREGDEPLAGHAWLISGGKPILEATDPNYKVTFTYPP